MILGIVGAEAAKFTPETEAAARQAIRSAIKAFGATKVVSGHSPLGGIDWWAIAEAHALGLEHEEFPAGVHTWESVKGVDGFKARNLKIARNSDVVVCITVKQLPKGYTGMGFPDGCYHCQHYAPHFGGRPPGPEDHVKSGGCWTMWQAAHLGKPTALVVIDPASPQAVAQAIENECDVYD